MFNRFFIQFIENKEIQAWKGICLAVFMGLTIFGESTIFQCYFLRLRELRIRLQGSLNLAIYNKVLKLSEQAKQKNNSGEIVNLVSVDVCRLAEVLTDILWEMLDIPLQLIISLCLLFSEIGFSGFIGFFFMLILILINAFL